MSNEVLDLATDGALLGALKKAVEWKPSAEELLKQRISFVYGSVNPASGITRTHIRNVLAEHAGSTSTSCQTK